MVSREAGGNPLGLSPDQMGAGDHGHYVIGTAPEHDRLEETPLLVLGATAAAQLGIPDDTINAYIIDHSRKLRLMAVSTKREATESLERAKKETLAHMMSNAAAIEHGEPLGAPVGARAERRNQAKAARSGRHNLEENLRTGANRSWVRDVRGNADMGLHRVDSLAMAATTFYISYGPEIDEGFFANHATVTLDADQATRMFGDPGRAGSVHMKEVAAATRSIDGADLSKKTLDERVTAFLQIATIDIAALAISDLRDYGKMGAKKAAQAKGIYDKYKDRLFSEDASVPLDMLNELAATARAASNAAPARETMVKSVLSSMSFRATRVVQHASAMSAMWREVYDKLGHEYHPVLQPQVAIEAEAPGAEEVPETVEEGNLATDGLSGAVGEEKRERFITHYLDEIILPDDSEGGLDGDDFQERLRKVAGDIAEESEIDGGGVLIIWERLYDLAHIASHYVGKLYKSKAGDLGAKRTEPYFVTFFSVGANNYGVAESPVYSHGTYVVSEEYANGPCLEVLKMRRKDARENGAVSIPHVKPHYHGPRHQQKIHTLIAAFEEGDLPARHAAMR